LKTGRLFTLVAISTTSLVTGCEKQVQQPTPMPATVSVIQAVGRDVVEWNEYPVRLESLKTVEAGSRVNGGSLKEWPGNEA
jgi:hypothetical protein